MNICPKPSSKPLNSKPLNPNGTRRVQSKGSGAADHRGSPSKNPKSSSDRTLQLSLKVILCMDSESVSQNVDLGIVLNYCQYKVLYLGSHYTTGPYKKDSTILGTVIWGNFHLGFKD